jgi:CRISPR-associated endonuclease/helicase Cas3
MMVTFVSQCEKKALKRTRRVLDSFAERIGDNTWQTIITKEGLDAVRKLLRKTASKSTAVSCHWIRSRSRSELLWIVGSREKFDERGVVPVHYTNDPFLDNYNEDGSWSFVNALSLISSLAGLFHDFGKANLLFQKKLLPNNDGKTYELYRHEWVSLRIFQAFVGSQSDREWLKKLVDVNSEVEDVVLNRLHKDPQTQTFHPLSHLPPIAKIVAWLVVSHHKLPVSSDETHRPELNKIDQWIRYFDDSWNSKNSAQAWSEDELSNNWYFEHGTPFKSAIWQIKASSLAEKALKCSELFEHEWFEQHFSLHTSRLALMFADHFYSNEDANREWQDRNYKCNANTDENGQIKQKLDEHNIGVAINACDILNTLPRLKDDLPSIVSNKEFKAKVPEDIKDQFGWQDRAFDLASQLKDECDKYGFFGINMASTGKGKTRGNARIMYALSEEEECRFSVALGLRTLTLQTGDAFKKHMKLKDDEYAVLIGSQAVKQLHEFKNTTENASKDSYQKKGSESSAPLLEEMYELKEQLADYDGRLSKWLKHDARILKLIQAPVLISTIDYLIPATEGTRGGRQIAPMLRLLTSDLVLDEPDDFGLEDLPALCRLVNWAGMLGSKVLLSTATMPPSIALALFDAYQSGRQSYVEAVGKYADVKAINCAWFDELVKQPFHAVIDSPEMFKTKHQEFVGKRLKKLQKEQKVFRKAKLVNIDQNDQYTIIANLAKTVLDSIHVLHKDHYVEHTTGKKVSLGLVRIANITPLVAIAKRLYATALQPDTRIHYCVYHSQYPLALQSVIEEKLDRALSRHDEEKWWKESGIVEEIGRYSEPNHIFVVLATPVAEVGRDHDYDWAIAEPSSMRSLIQLAGRVQRHRNKEPSTENFYVLETNYKALNGESPAFWKPGFETSKRMFFSHNLHDILKPELLKEINASSRIEQPATLERDIESGKFKDFVQLEHAIQNLRLLGNKNEHDHASQWWRKNATWCAELQRIQPFRQSAPDETFCLAINYNDDTLGWEEINTYVKPVEYDRSGKIRPDNTIECAEGNMPWFALDSREIIKELAEKFKMEEKDVCRRFTEVRLPKGSKNKPTEWKFSEVFGVYRELNKGDA